MMADGGNRGLVLEIEAALLADEAGRNSASENYGPMTRNSSITPCWKVADISSTTDRIMGLMYCSFYLRKGTAFVPTPAKTVAGYWMAIDPSMFGRSKAARLCNRCCWRRSSEAIPSSPRRPETISLAYHEALLWPEVSIDR